MKVKETKEIIKDAMIVVYAPTDDNLNWDIYNHLTGKIYNKTEDSKFDDFEIEEISIEVEEDKPVAYIYIK